MDSEYYRTAIWDHYKDKQQLKHTRQDELHEQSEDSLQAAHIRNMEVLKFKSQPVADYNMAPARASSAINPEMLLALVQQQIMTSRQINPVSLSSSASASTNGLGLTNAPPTSAVVNCSSSSNVEHLTPEMTALINDHVQAILTQMSQSNNDEDDNAI